MVLVSILNYFTHLSEFFKKLKLREPLQQVQFQLFEKLTSANFHTKQEKQKDILFMYT